MGIRSGYRAFGMSASGLYCWALGPDADTADDINPASPIMRNTGLGV